ncbi:stereocilin [Variovorax sp. PAMC26660]|nr:stereocilin [Variovorax sp. PAMC26660]QNK66719.1 stereocilin [Variovorax sp. PAMC26660]
MATHPDLPTPVTSNLPVEPDEGPSPTPDEPTDPEPPPTVS